MGSKWEVEWRSTITKVSKVFNTLNDAHIKCLWPLLPSKQFKISWKQNEVSLVIFKLHISLSFYVSRAFIIATNTPTGQGYSHLHLGKTFAI